MKGTERIWTSLTVKLIRGTVPSGTTDNIGPTVSKVALSDKPDGTVMAAVDATDPSGIARDNKDHPDRRHQHAGRTVVCVPEPHGGVRRHLRRQFPDA